MSTGIDFVIGGKDNATSAMDKVDQALGRLQARTGKLAEATKTMVVNVTGAKSTLGGLSTGAAPVDKAAKATSTQIAGLSASLAKLKATAGPLLAVFAAVKTVTAGVGAIKDSAAAYDEQAESVRGLESALAAGIGPAAGMSEKLQQAAAGLESLTGISDRTTLAMMKQASHLGVHSGQLDQVAKAAIGLAEATGKDLTEATNMVAAAVKGDFSAFAELIPQINMATTAEQKLAMVQQLSAKGMELKAKQSGSLATITARAGNAIQKLMESVGALLAPMRLLIASGTKALADSLRGALSPAVERAKEILQNMTPIMAAVGEAIKAAVQVGKVAFGALWEAIKAIGSAAASVFGVQFSTSAQTMASIAEKLRDIVIAVANKIIAGITWIEVIVTNLGPVWEAMKASAELQLLRLSEIVKHALTKAVPAYVQWFAENFVNLMVDGFNAVTTVVSNALTTVGEIVKHSLTKVIPAYTTWFADNFTNLVRDAFNGAVTIVTNAMKNIGDAVMLGWDFITSMGEGGIDKLLADMSSIANRSITEGFKATTDALPEIEPFKISTQSLLDGFKATTAALPEIAARQITEREQQLAEKIGKVGENLGKQFTDKFNARMVTVGKDVSDNLSKDINLRLNTNVAGDKPQLQASEGRLTTRGPAERQMQVMEAIERNTKAADVRLKAVEDRLGTISEGTAKTAENTAKKGQEIQLVGVPE